MEVDDSQYCADLLIEGYESDGSTFYECDAFEDSYTEEVECKRGEAGDLDEWVAQDNMELLDSVPEFVTPATGMHPCELYLSLP